MYVKTRSSIQTRPRPRPPIRSRGMGADCGANPCTWWDDVYMRDACIAYTQCADPNSPMLKMVQKGLIVGGSEIVGSTVGEAAGGGIQAATKAFFQDPATGGTNWGTVAVVAVGGILLIELLPVLLGGRR